MGLSKFEVYLPFELSVRSNSKNKPARRRSYKGIKPSDQWEGRIRSYGWQVYSPNGVGVSEWGQSALGD